MENNRLKAKEVEVHFFFGFLFSRLEFGPIEDPEIQIHHRHVIEKSMKNAILNHRHFKHKVIPNSVGLVTTEPRNQIQYYLLLDRPYFSLEFKPVAIKICVGKPSRPKGVWLSAKLQRFIRLYESGMGLYRAVVHFSSPPGTSTISAADIVSVAGAGSATEEGNPEKFGKKRFFFSYREQKLNIFDWYCKDIEQLQSAFSSRMSSVYKDSSLMHETYSRLVWLEMHEGLIASVSTRNPQVRFQNPYILTKITIPKELLKPEGQGSSGQCEQKGDTSFINFKGDIQNILFRRLEPDATSIDYVQKYTQSIDGTLANMCISSRVFLNMHIRSTIYVYSNSSRSKYMDKLLFPSIIDTVELIRMHWYAYVMINQYMDNHAKELVEQFNLLLLDKNESLLNGRLEQCQEEIIRMKSELLRVLGLPLSYRRASATSTTLYDFAERLFEIKNLQGIVAKKADCLDKLFDNINDVRRRIEFEAMESY